MKNLFTDDKSKDEIEEEEEFEKTRTKYKKIFKNKIEEFTKKNNSDYIEVN